MLPHDWATLKQPAPTNHGTPVIDALRPGQPLRALLGDFLSDAAIARAEMGRKTYGSLLTPYNGRDQAVDALQELADAAVYLSAWHAETPKGLDTIWAQKIRYAMDSVRDASASILQAMWAMPGSIEIAEKHEKLMARIAAESKQKSEAQPTDLERLLRHEAESESEVKP